ncbi:hypothetical protein DVH24_001703 [Malus domestica]|uniref:Uncharacterized protein n=1 Tax=Malus domestica TaxID=3750 RepID=A0A498I7Y8_MALDO|nr:hypothetical protein DVH24_001703 [Malus domestica]
MFENDAEIKDEDKFLHMTYTGKQKQVIGAARSGIIPRRVRRKTTANRAAARSDIAPGRDKVRFVESPTVEKRKGGLKLLSM